MIITRFLKGSISVKEIILSDYVKDTLKAKEVDRDREYIRKLDDYKKIKTEIENKNRAQKKIASDEWKKGSHIKAAYLFVKFFCTRLFQSSPQEPVKELPDQSDKQWVAGANGENIVSTFLSNKLSDEWTYLRGYENRKGEVDGMLIGPTGVFAIEIKYRRGALICNGDRWLIDRYDKYGNLVERMAEFQKGRSPSLQLNEPSDVLEETLRRKGIACQIFRIVVLSHEKAKIEELKNITVDEIVVLHEWDLEKTLKKGKMNLSNTEASRIAFIISNHHVKPMRKNGEVKTALAKDKMN